MHMGNALFIFDYLVWHYSRAFRDIGALWYNLVWFVTHFFSLPLLVRTLISPWKRLSDGYRREGVEKLMETFVFNLMSRVVGFVIRMALILAGLTVLTVLSLSLVVFLMVWLFLPFLAVLSFALGTILFLV
jgi:hypothetical protein